MVAYRFPRPQCRYRLLPEIDNGTFCRQSSPRPGPVSGISLWPELYSPDSLPAAMGMADAITDANKAEFAIIKKIPVYNSRRRSYRVNVPELIRKGMSQELADKIASVRGSIRVKELHAEQFHAGGFNPRPIKFSHRYLLGTLSEHATGMAVDIDDRQNAQLTNEELKCIGKLVGKHIVRSGGWTTEAAAEDLWNDIKKVNDLFVEKVAAEVKRIEKERAEKEKAEQSATKPVTSQPAEPQKLITPLQEILGKHFKSLSQWATTGFFHLPLDLVLEFRDHGFTWGATFSTNADLHHFELDE